MDRFNGLLVVDKPGRTRDSADAERDFPTSHDIVQQARRWSKQRRIGHTGTLDPLASGVLVLCLGPSTRLVEYYQGHPKQYYAEVVLGRSTDSYDAFGETVDERPIPSLTSDQIEAALTEFRGSIQQKPPIFSALKQDGESLHHKARRGESVEVKPRSVTLHTLELLDFPSPERIILRTTCSAGTYIRSLAHDLGVVLGSVAHLDILRREAAGPFTLSDAASITDLADAAERDTLREFLYPPAHRLDLPEIELTNELITRFGYGQKVVLELSGYLEQEASSNNPMAHEADLQQRMVIAKAINPHGTFAGIVRLLGDARSSTTQDATSDSETENDGDGDGEQPHATVWKAEKWFAST